MDLQFVINFDLLFSSTVIWKVIINFLVMVLTLATVWKDLSKFNKISLSIVALALILSNCYLDYNSEMEISSNKKKADSLNTLNDSLSKANNLKTDSLVNLYSELNSKNNSINKKSDELIDVYKQLDGKSLTIIETEHENSELQNKIYDNEKGGNSIPIIIANIGSTSRPLAGQKSSGFESLYFKLINNESHSIPNVTIDFQEHKWHQFPSISDTIMYVPGNFNKAIKEIPLLDGYEYPIESASWEYEVHWKDTFSYTSIFTVERLNLNDVTFEYKVSQTAYGYRGVYYKSATDLESRIKKDLYSNDMSSKRHGKN